MGFFICRTHVNIFIGECKNYTKPVGVTYVGKFYSLLRTTNINCGIFFSIKGLGGKTNWDSSKGLVRKMALRDNTYILDVEYLDFLAIYQKKENIFSVLERKYSSLKCDISYDSFVKKHDLEGILI